MSIFNNEELGEFMRTYVEQPGRISEMILDHVEHEADHITISNVQAGLISGKRQSKHIREFCVRESTPLEREHGGERMSFITLEDWQHDN